MSFWKILGGAAIGVGAIAAAPFTGGGSLLGAATLAGSLAGAGTVAAAVGAGVAGAAVGAAMGGDDYEKGRSEGKKEGQKQGKAESAVEIAAMEKKFEELLARLDAAAVNYKAIYAMEAVAVAVASCDGEICDAERKQIEEFISGISRSVLPQEVKDKIEDLYKNPVNIKEAFEMASATSIGMEVYDSIIQVVMHADGIKYEEEKVFIQAWNELKRVA